MKRTNIYLRARQVKDLKILSAETGASVSELIRRAVDEYVKQKTAARGQ